jgi:hypothetical protein
MLAAQQDTTGLTRQMILEREYDPTVQDANKVNTLPAIKEPTVNRLPIDYSAFTIPADPQREINILSAGHVMDAMKYNSRRGYLNLGAGMYMNINGDLGYHIISNERTKLNIYAAHRSTNGNVKYDEYNSANVAVSWKGYKVKAKENDNIGRLDFRHAFSKAALSLGAAYGYSAYNYYGRAFTYFPEQTFVPYSNSLPTPNAGDVETMQANQQIRANLGLESLPAASPLEYKVLIDYTNFSQKYDIIKEKPGTKEQTVGAALGLGAPFNGNLRIGVDAKAEYFLYAKADKDKGFANYLNGTVTPRFNIEGTNWNVQLGANLMLTSGLADDHFFLSPNILADVTLGSKTVLYLRADGNIRSNSQYQLLQEMRYLVPGKAVVPSRRPLDSQIGVKSSVFPGFRFHLFGQYRITNDDRYFIVNNNRGAIWGGLTQALLLDSKTLIGGLELQYAYQKLFEINLKGVYNKSYLTDRAEYNGTAPVYKIPYGRPQMEISGNVLVRPIEKLSVGLNYYMATNRWTRHFDEDVKMNDIRSLGLTGTYNINDTFGIYLKADNLLFQNYEYLYGYPTQGFSLMAGVNINF